MNLNNTEIEDFDKYIIKKRSSDIINEYTIIVYFKDESISGACYRCSFLDHMINIKEAIKMLKDINKYGTPKRDFTSILEKYI